MKWGIAIVLALLAILYVAFQYSMLRTKYDSLFSWYGSLTKQNAAATPSIGPTRIALGYERPWLAAYMTRPITQPMAEFMIRLVSAEQITPAYLAVGPGRLFTDPAGALKKYCACPGAWDGSATPAGLPANPLGTGGGGHVPYNSDLVQGYRAQIGSGSAGCPPAPAGLHADLSLLTLWMHGYEEYVRQRFTAGATSVMQEWNYMFASELPAPVPTPAACAATSVASDIISAGVGAAGVGAMMGAPEGGIGAVPGAVIGFVLGAAGSLLGKTSCL